MTHMKNHAFIFQVHKSPELFGRIVRALAKENHYFFVNVDKKTKNYNGFLKETTGIPNVHFLNERISVHHGGISQVDATLALIKAVIDSGIQIDFIHSMSGQDYPLRSNEQFDEFFERTEKSYMAFEGEEYHHECMKRKYPQRMNLWHFNNNHKLLAKLYRKSHLIDVVSKLIPRQNVNKCLWGVELVHLEHSNCKVCISVFRRAS